ncbi:N-acetylmuramoyl-L-alanine amidase [Breoghania corrubedonensis]|uniref:N-acetylmuramoyl-L-alanine amidase n=1 Tax=Breoghania corrubedonensis TaxID=665038 RepID=A0A2T5V936_9HYPH|nr:N-acetylmuramoyl-L-alanine amidase [Breoghania corrubedonensis]PTW60269.1 N-acetylmuramoyl-L-alanine amidase [Breoghania corrubedonensis]
MKLRQTIAALAVAFAAVYATATLAADANTDDGPRDETATVVARSARVVGDSARTRFIVDLSRPVTFAASALAAPDRVILDMPEVRFDLPPKSGDVGRGLIKAWRYGLIAPGKSRIVLDLSGPARIDKSFVLPSVDNQPARLVIDFVKTTGEAFLSDYPRPDAEATGKTAEKGDRKVVGDVSSSRPVIVLDPGHGGIDTGAVGVDGVYEKNVVLEFAELLKAKLDAEGTYEVLMTRDDDRFIPLGKRVEFARQQGASLFVSVHADSAPQSYVRGATVYTLSERASDAIAAALAKRENSSDILAGADLEDEPDDVADILIDLARRETKSFSVLFARTLVSEFESAVKLIKNPWRSAGFRVLKAYDVPSVLVELGYLSNKHDESLLLSGEWRERAASAMVTSIDRFFQPRLAQGQ